MENYLVLVESNPSMFRGVETVMNDDLIALQEYLVDLAGNPHANLDDLGLYVPDGAEDEAEIKEMVSATLEGASISKIDPDDLRLLDIGELSPKDSMVQLICVFKFRSSDKEKTEYLFKVSDNYKYDLVADHMDIIGDNRKISLAVIGAIVYAAATNGNATYIGVETVFSEDMTLPELQDRIRSDIHKSGQLSESDSILPFASIIEDIEEKMGMYLAFKRRGKIKDIVVPE